MMDEDDDFIEIIPNKEVLSHVTVKTTVGPFKGGIDDISGS